MQFLIAHDMFLFIYCRFYKQVDKVKKTANKYNSF